MAFGQFSGQFHLNRSFLKQGSHRSPCLPITIITIFQPYPHGLHCYSFISIKCLHDTSYFLKLFPLKNTTLSNTEMEHNPWLCRTDQHTCWHSVKPVKLPCHISAALTAVKFTSSAFTQMKVAPAPVHSDTFF